MTNINNTAVKEGRCESRSKEKVEEVKWCEADRLGGCQEIIDLARMFGARVLPLSDSSLGACISVHILYETLICAGEHLKFPSVLCHSKQT